MGFLTGDCGCHCDPPTDCFGCGGEYPTFPAFIVEWAGNTPTYAIDKEATGNRITGLTTVLGVTGTDTLYWDYVLPAISNIFYSGVQINLHPTECQWGKSEGEEAHVFRRGKRRYEGSPTSDYRRSAPSHMGFDAPYGLPGTYYDDFTLLDTQPSSGFVAPTPSPGGYEVYDPDYNPASFVYGTMVEKFIWFLFILDGSWTLRGTLRWSNQKIEKFERPIRQADASYLAVGDGTDSTPGGGQVVTYTKTLVCNTDLDGSPVTLTTASAIPPQSALGIDSPDPIIDDWPTTVTITPVLPYHLQGVGWPT